MNNDPLSAIQASLTVSSRLEALSDVLSWFEQSDLSSLDSQLILESQTALIEAFTNAVRHAHAHLPVETPIKIQIRLDETRLQLRIWDQGQPYDFDAAMFHLSQSNEHNLQPLNREKHWGQVLFLRLARDRDWQFSYDRLPTQENCFVMHKALGDTPQSDLLSSGFSNRLN